MTEGQSLLVDLQTNTQPKEKMCFFSMEAIHSAWKGTMLIGSIIGHAMNPASEPANDTDFQDLMVMLFLF